MRLRFCNSPATGARGFTLLEVLVAFTITALALGVVFQTYGRGAHAMAAAAHYSRAVTLADSLLAVAGVEEELAPGEVAGESEDGFRWVRTTSEHVDIEIVDEGPQSQGVSAWEVEVEVSWNQGQRSRSLQLATLRLGTL